MAETTVNGALHAAGHSAPESGADMLRPLLGLTVWTVELAAIPASLALAVIDVLQTADARAAALARRNARRVVAAQTDTLFAIRYTIDDFVKRLARAADATRARLAA